MSTNSNSIRVFMVQDTLSKGGWKMVPSHAGQTPVNIRAGTGSIIGNGFIERERWTVAVWLQEQVYPEFEASLADDTHLIIIVHVGDEAQYKGKSPVFNYIGVKSIFEKYVPECGYVAIFKEIVPNWQVSFATRTHEGKGRSYMVWPDEVSSVGFRANYLLTTI